MTQQPEDELIIQLRAGAASDGVAYMYPRILKQAADEIERLRKVLQDIVETPRDMDGGGCDCKFMARDALEQKVVGET